MIIRELTGRVRSPVMHTDLEDRRVGKDFIGSQNEFGILICRPWHIVAADVRDAGIVVRGIGDRDAARTISVRMDEQVAIAGDLAGHGEVITGTQRTEIAQNDLIRDISVVMRIHQRGFIERDGSRTETRDLAGLKRSAENSHTAGECIITRESETIRIVIRARCHVEDDTQIAGKDSGIVKICSKSLRHGQDRSVVRMIGGTCT